jgi:hypothetical protein
VLDVLLLVGLGVMVVFAAIRVRSPFGDGHARIDGVA